MQVWEIRAGHAPQHYEVRPDELGLTMAGREALIGGTVAENAATIRALLDGDDQGPRRISFC